MVCGLAAAKNGVRPVANKIAVFTRNLICAQRSSRGGLADSLKHTPWPPIHRRMELRAENVLR